MKKHNINRILFILLAVVLCLDILSLGVCPAFAAEASGTCGANVQWSLQNGKLTVSGQGSMANYSKNDPAPWHDLRQQIQSVSIAAGVTTVGSEAFYDCDNLVVVTLPDSVTKIGRYAFAQCEKLVQVRLSGALTSIGDSAFEECVSLKTIRLPQFLTKLGHRVFYRCESLGGITIPAGVTELGTMMFGYCYRLRTVYIEAPIKSVPRWFFYGCINLIDVYLPDSVEAVEENAFSECPKLDFVDCGDNKKLQEQITQELKEPTALGEPGERYVEYVETDNAIIVVDTYFPDETSDEEPRQVIDAVVENQTGWQEVMDYVSDNLGVIKPVVNVEVPADENLDGQALKPLVGKDVTVNIHTNENNEWQLNMNHQTEDSLQNEQEVGVQMTPYQPTPEQKETVGEADSYLVNLGTTNWNTTILVPMGTESVRDTASIYQVEADKSLTHLQSVIVDDSGKAAFSLAGTTPGEYVVALNAPNISKDEVRVPPSLYGEYGIDPQYTLMGMDGQYYTITGMKSSLGINIGQMTLIIVAALVVTMAAVGGVMFVRNKQKLAKGYVPQFEDEDDEE